MELRDYTTEELKDELKRRAEVAKAEKEEEMKNALRCRNCIHCSPNPNWKTMYICMARTWGKNIIRHYSVSLSKKACDKFEKRNNYGN